MRKLLALSGIVMCGALMACTALTSTDDASSSAQLHDTRMRMRHGTLLDAAPTNYGSRADMQEPEADLSVPANQNATMLSDHRPTGVAGNAPMSQMPDAGAMPDPEPTHGNAPPTAYGR